MYLLSSKGLTLVIVGVGLVLSLVGPSDADPVKCYSCGGKTQCEGATDKWQTTECPSGKCSTAVLTQMGEKEVNERTCAREDAEEGCRPARDEPHKQFCTCLGEFCNKETAAALTGSGGGSGGGAGSTGCTLSSSMTTSASLFLGAFLLLRYGFWN